MVLFLKEDNEIYAYNKRLRKEDIEKYPDTIWYEGDFDFLDGEDKEGYTKLYKWDGEKPVLEYEPIPESPVPEPSMEEQILSGVNSTNGSQLTIMEALATQYEEGLENDLNNKEVLATIYEELLALKEVK